VELLTFWTKFTPLAGFKRTLGVGVGVSVVEDSGIVVEERVSPAAFDIIIIEETTGLDGGSKGQSMTIGVRVIGSNEIPRLPFGLGELKTMMVIHGVS
jgi:hypothetical protein